jgi:hypothetical protein
MADLRAYLHRYWFRLEPSVPDVSPLGYGVTALDRRDAERLLASKVFGSDDLPPILDVIEDVDVRELDPGHVLPNMGDPATRGVWYPRL